MRTAQIKRRTAETDIRLSLNLDGSGRSSITTRTTVETTAVVASVFRFFRFFSHFAR